MNVHVNLDGRQIIHKMLKQWIAIGMLPVRGGGSNQPAVVCESMFSKLQYQCLKICDSPHIFWWHVFRINCSAPTYFNISESENKDVGVTLLWAGMIVWPRCESDGSVPPGELYVTLWHCCCCLDPIKLSNSPSCQIFTREIFESSKLPRFQIV